MIVKTFLIALVLSLGGCGIIDTVSKTAFESQRDELKNEVDLLRLKVERAVLQRRLENIEASNDAD